MLKATLTTWSPRHFFPTSLHLDEELLDVDDLVADEGLEEDAEQPHEAVLHVLVVVLGLARAYAVADVQVQELLGQLDGRREHVDHLHRVQ